MQDFEYVVCTKGDGDMFLLNKEYKVLSKDVSGFTLRDEYGHSINVIFEGNLWHFSPVYSKDRFIPVSGDQSLFDLVNAQNTHLYVVRNRGESGIYATTQAKMDKYPKLKERVLAQRKVKEKDYVPVVGDTIEIKDEFDFSTVYEVSLIGDRTIVLRGGKGSPSEFTTMHKDNDLLKKAKKL